MDLKSLAIIAFLSLAIAHANEVHRKGGQCGGFAGFVCDDGLECKYGTNQWDPPHPDAAGTCVDPTKELCGGFAAFRCPDRWFCVLDGNFPDAGGHCEQCPLRKCPAVLCPAGTTAQSTRDENNCPGCPVCVGTAQPQACGRGLPQCPDGYFCDVAPDDRGSVCRPNQRFCTRDAKICPDGTAVGRDSDNNCEFFPCPREQRFCTEDARLCPDGTSVGRDPDNNCAFFPCPSQLFCTLDARICPDGTSVGRDPNNNCTFFPCPSVSRGCTKDARICPDGTSVGRDADNNCRFFPCPKPCNPNKRHSCSNGQKCSPRCKRRNGRKFHSCVPTAWHPLKKLPQCPNY